MSDWLGSETRLAMDLAERGAYRDLLDYQYQEGSIPSDPAVLARFLGVSMDQFNRIWERVSKKFEPDPHRPDRLVNPRAADVIGEEEAYRRQQAKHGSKGGRPKGSGKVAFPEKGRKRVAFQKLKGF